ncbi:MAG: trigger factor, partial [Nautilia sp.]
KEKVAKRLSKQVKVDGFRKGKVPVAIVKKMYGETIEKEAVDELIKKEYQEALKELGIKQEDIIGEPIFTKFDRGEDKTEIEIKLSLKPEVVIEDYEKLIPEVELPKISDEEVEEKIKEYAKEASEPVKVDKEVAEKGDFAVIDFIGYIDGKEMENGEANDYPLELGSNTFIPGFEDQVVDMKVGEEKEIKVKFPEEYHSKEIAGKEATFKVKLKEIRAKQVPEIDDELAKKLLQKEDATVETLKDEIKKELLMAKKAEVFAPKKEELIENLIKEINFDLPDLVVEKEAELVINEKASKMTPEEIKELTSNEEKLNELREEAKKEAAEKVKLTFIIDELAKKENVVVDDNQVLQVLYFEALRAGQDAEKLIEYYKENNLLPAVKMSMVQEQLLSTLLDKKAK